MTATSTIETSTAAPRRDLRPGPRSRGLLLASGGLLFALGNALHPLTHSDAATAAPTWAAAHLTFALGALLILGGLPGLAPRLACSRAGLTGLVLTGIAMVFVVGGAYVEVYVAPLVGHAAMERIEDGATLWSIAATVTFVLGPTLTAVVGWWQRTLPVVACAAVVLAQLTLIVGPALPLAEGWTIIPSTVVLGLALAELGRTVAARGDRHDGD